MNFNYIPYISFCENNINNNVEQLVATIIILMWLTAKPIASILIITYIVYYTIIIYLRLAVHLCCDTVKSMVGQFYKL